jgi:hypothetical protein
MDLYLAFHQHAAAAVGEHAIPDRRPLLAPGLFESGLEVRSVGGFDQLELIALVGHLGIIGLYPRRACGDYLIC